MYHYQCHVSKLSCLSTTCYFDNLSTDVLCLKLMNSLIDRSTEFSDCCRFSGDMPLQVSELLVYV